MNSKKRYSNLASIAIGTVAFLYFADWRFLNVKNTGWLFLGANSDKAQAYLGWEFFRQTDWSFPLGKNESFGLLQSNSIAYSDSIPLLALIAKLFNGFLGEHYQYFGIWLLLCFILQSLFSALIIQQFTHGVVFPLVTSCLSVTNPVFLQRVPIHLALSGHFLILTSLYLFIKSKRGASCKFAWLTLNITSLMIHPYLFVMVFFIFLAYMIQSGLAKSRTRISLIIELIVSIFVLVVILSMVLGIPLTSRTGASRISYGTHPWNLLSLFNPRDWPRFLNVYPARDSGFDTFSYPGLGILILILTAFVLLLKRRNLVINSIFRSPPLLVAILGLLIFAITHRVGIGNVRIVLFESQTLESTFSIFRASARMAWPFIYSTILFSSVVIFRVTSQRTARVLLLLALVLQFADVRLAPGFLFPQKNSAQETTGPTVDPFWKSISGRYERILVLQKPESDVTGWPEIAIAAESIGLATNSAYLARYDSNELKFINAKIQQEIASGNYDPDAVYVIYDDDTLIDLNSGNAKFIRLGNKIVVLPRN